MTTHDDSDEQIPVYRDGDDVRYPDNSMLVLRATRSGRMGMSAWARGHYAGRRIPAGVLPGLKTIGFIHSVADGQLPTGEHRNEGFEIHFVECGRIAFHAAGREHHLKAGDVVYTDPWASHTLGCLPASGFRVHWIVLDVGVRGPAQEWQWPAWILLTDKDRHDFRRLLEGGRKSVWHAPTRFKACFQQIAGVVHSELPDRSAAQLAVLVNQVLVSLLKTVRGRQAHDEDAPGLAAVEAFWERLRGDPAQLARLWNLGLLAAESGLGVTQLSLHTRQLYNHPPMHYLRSCQLEQARWMLLEDPRRGVQEIGHACGFAECAQFSRAFRRYFGCPPQIYRAQTFSLPPPNP